MIGLVLLLLLPTRTIWFSLAHKQNVSDGVVSGIRTLFSLDHKLHASDYDSDSLTSENQPLGITLQIEPRFVFFLVEEEKRRLCLNRVKPLTSQSCFSGQIGFSSASIHLRTCQKLAGGGGGNRGRVTTF